MRGIKDFNFPLFFETAKCLKLSGHIVFNPAEHDIAVYGDRFKSDTGSMEELKGWFNLADAFEWDAKVIIHDVDAVVFLPGWQNSSGAKAEMAIAKLMGRKLLNPDLTPLVETNEVRMTDPTVRTFETGAIRNLEHNKLDYEGFLSPLAVEAFAKYMHHHRKLPDGSMRSSDNWQKGMPLDCYMKSAWRHFFDWWKLHRGLKATDENGNPVTIEEMLCALLFNVQGYLHELKKKELCRAAREVTNLTATGEVPGKSHD